MKFVQHIFVFLSITIALFCGVTISNAEVKEQEEVVILYAKHIVEIKFAIEKLQPYYKSKTPKRRDLLDNLAQSIYWAAIVNDIDYRGATALASRESSLHPAILQKKHAIGYFQIRAFGAAQNECSDGCNLFDLGCNVDTAMCWLDKCRDKCGDNPWLYFGGYGRSYCPKSVSVAKQWQELRALRSKLCKGFGEVACNEVLPL